MKHSKPNFPKTYTVDIGPVSIATHNTSRELAITAALYWLGQNATMYGMDPNQHVMEGFLHVDTVGDGSHPVVDVSQFPNMRECRTAASAPPTSDHTSLDRRLGLDLQI